MYLVLRNSLGGEQFNDGRTSYLGRQRDRRRWAQDSGVRSLAPAGILLLFSCGIIYFLETYFLYSLLPWILHWSSGFRRVFLHKEHLVTIPRCCRHVMIWTLFSTSIFFLLNLPLIIHHNVHYRLNMGYFYLPGINKLAAVVK